MLNILLLTPHTVPWSAKKKNHTDVTFYVNITTEIRPPMCEFYLRTCQITCGQFKIKFTVKLIKNSTVLIIERLQNYG